MGVKEKDIVCHMAGQAQTLPWLSTYVSALVCQAANDHKTGQQLFQALVQVSCSSHVTHNNNQKYLLFIPKQVFPNIKKHVYVHAQNFPESVEALGGLAICQMEIGNNDEAVQAFSQVSHVHLSVYHIIPWSLPIICMVPCCFPYHMGVSACTVRRGLHPCCML